MKQRTERKARNYYSSAIIPKRKMRDSCHRGGEQSTQTAAQIREKSDRRRDAPPKRGEKKNPAIGKTKETEEAAKDDTHTKAREARTIVSGSSCSTVAVFDAGDRS